MHAAVMRRWRRALRPCMSGIRACLPRLRRWDSSLCITWVQWSTISTGERAHVVLISFIMPQTRCYHFLCSATEESRAHVHGSLFHALQASPHMLLRELASGPWSPSFSASAAPSSSVAVGVASRAVSYVKSSSTRSLPFGRARLDFAALMRRYGSCVCVCASGCCAHFEVETALWRCYTELKRHHLT